MFQISLRQLLFLVAAVALAIVSLKYASPFWRGTIGFATMLYFFAAAIVAFIERGAQQAAAIGVVVTILGYAILVRNEQLTANQSLDRLPTTHFIDTLYKSVRYDGWVDETTGKVLGVRAGNSRPAPLSPGGRVIGTVVPDEWAFNRIGHCWTALLLAYVAGHFARFVYVRRNRRESAPQSE